MEDVDVFLAQDIRIDNNLACGIEKMYPSLSIEVGPPGI